MAVQAQNESLDDHDSAQRWQQRGVKAPRHERLGVPKSMPKSALSREFPTGRVMLWRTIDG